MRLPNASSPSQKQTKRSSEGVPASHPKPKETVSRQFDENGFEIQWPRPAGTPAPQFDDSGQWPRPAGHPQLAVETGTKSSWPFPAGGQSVTATGLEMPRSTATRAEIKTWVSELSPAERLDVLRTGGPLYVVQSTIDAISDNGGVRAHELYFSRDDLALKLLIDREIRGSDHRQVSIAYANLASSSLTNSYQPVLERVMRLELLGRAIARRFGGKLDLGDE